MPSLLYRRKPAAEVAVATTAVSAAVAIAGAGQHSTAGKATSPSPPRAAVEYTPPPDGPVGRAVTTAAAAAAAVSFGGTQTSFFGGTDDESDKDNGSDDASMSAVTNANTQANARASFRSTTGSILTKGGSGVAGTTSPHRVLPPPEAVDTAGAIPAANYSGSHAGASSSHCAHWLLVGRWSGTALRAELVCRADAAAQHE